MSKYSFIATDYVLPEVYNIKVKRITVEEAIRLGIKPHEHMTWEKMNPKNEVIIVNDKDDLEELVIKKDSSFEKNVRWYTNKQYIYSITFGYNESRAEQLLKYLKENIKRGYTIELWTIWLDDKQNVKPNICKHDELTIDWIRKIYGTHIDYIFHSCTIIEG